MLKEKENTYATLPFADEYVARYNVEYAPLRVHWSVLTDEEKEQYLEASLSQIEKLPFIGRKYNTYQPLQFPRRRDGYGGYYPPGYPFVQVESNEVPNEVREAQAENALGILSEQINAVSDKQFMTMQSLGAVKNTKYNKREAGDLGFGAELKGGSQHIEIASLRAYQLLRNWLGGLRC